MKIAIIGKGKVGTAMNKLFQDAVIYDKYLEIGSIDEVNECQCAFICVPTPMLSNGACDTSEVENVISQITCDVIVIRSTVEIGFTDRMVEKYKKKIIFQPEYFGETVNHPFADIKNQGWLSFGGEQSSIDLAIKAYMTVVNSNTRIIQMPAKEVELAKYMENAYLALKVTFCNEMYELAKCIGINYNLTREAWVQDPRIGTSHTFVYEDNRGYSGKCLPKDVAALLKIAKDNDVNMQLIEAMVKSNNELVTKNK